MLENETRWTRPHLVRLLLHIVKNIPELLTTISAACVATITSLGRLAVYTKDIEQSMVSIYRDGSLSQHPLHEGVS